MLHARPCLSSSTIIPQLPQAYIFYSQFPGLGVMSLPFWQATSGPQTHGHVLHSEHCGSLSRAWSAKTFSAWASSAITGERGTNFFSDKRGLEKVSSLPPLGSNLTLTKIASIKVSRVAPTTVPARKTPMNCRISIL